ncbi:MAG: substrate-binding domain-containing protein [Gemmatimonadetes bacterium]|nr:substrate-binding domain-containing protein [Gemmatimonadota bacterium]
MHSQSTGESAVKFHKYGAAAVAIAAVAIAADASAQSRDQIKIVGSSTVFPYTQAVAEEFANETGNSSPVVEATGTGGGMKIFCQGVGPGHPDATGASRAMKKSEVELCQKNGVTEVSEALLGDDGLSLAVSRNGETLDVTKAQLFQALAAEAQRALGGRGSVHHIAWRVPDEERQRLADDRQPFPVVVLVGTGDEERERGRVEAERLTAAGFAAAAVDWSPFAEVAGDFRAYALGNGHRHLAEMRQALPGLQLLFTPHLLPVPRGILETLAVPVAPGVDAYAVRRAWSQAYGDGGPVRVHRQTPALSDVVGTDLLLLDASDNAGLDAPVVTVVAALDNLGKGAAGQAVQNMNLMLGLEPWRGLRC